MDYSKYCKRCEHYRYDFHDGVICGLYQEKPTFNETCTDIKLRSYPDGFNWGAFSLTSLWLITHNRIPYGVVIFLLLVFSMFIPSLILPVVVVVLLAKVYFGYYGNKISWKETENATLDAVEKKEKVWNVAGLIVLFLSIASILSVSIYKLGWLF